MAIDVVLGRTESGNSAAHGRVSLSRPTEPGFAAPETEVCEQQPRDSSQGERAWGDPEQAGDYL